MEFGENNINLLGLYRIILCFENHVIEIHIVVIFTNNYMDYNIVGIVVQFGVLEESRRIYTMFARKSEGYDTCNIEAYIANISRPIYYY